jgi:hypothetical protein
VLNQTSVDEYRVVDKQSKQVLLPPNKHPATRLPPQKKRKLDDTDDAGFVPTESGPPQSNINTTPKVLEISNTPNQFTPGRTSAFMPVSQPVCMAPPQMPVVTKPIWPLPGRKPLFFSSNSSFGKSMIESTFSRPPNLGNASGTVLSNESTIESSFSRPPNLGNASGTVLSNHPAAELVQCVVPITNTAISKPTNDELIAISALVSWPQAFPQPGSQAPVRPRARRMGPGNTIL